MRNSPGAGVCLGFCFEGETEDGTEAGMSFKLRLINDFALQRDRINVGRRPPLSRK
jgi:hypothetical protein